MIIILVGEMSKIHSTFNIMLIKIYLHKQLIKQKAKGIV